MEPRFQIHSCRTFGNKGATQQRIVAKFSQPLQTVADGSSLGVKQQLVCLMVPEMPGEQIRNKNDRAGIIFKG